MARLGRSQAWKATLVRVPDLGPVYFDNFSTSNYEASLSTYNFTHVVGTNTNRLLTVGVSTFAAGTVSTITYGGVSLTKLRADVNGIYNSELWYLIAPASGSATVTVTLSASLTSIAGGASWWNVDQTTPFSANAGANGTNTPASGVVTPGSITNRVFGNLSAQTASDAVTNKIDQAPHCRAGGTLGTQEGSELGVIMGLTSTTLQWDGLGVTDSWAISLGAIQPPQPVVGSNWGPWIVNGLNWNRIVQNGY